jgi:GTPase SAR1 family protein
MVPQTRGEGWQALKELANDFHFNPLVWFISSAVKPKDSLTHDEIIVYGPPGSGKTSYVIQSMLYVFEDVNEVRKRIVFDVDDFKRLLENVKNGQRYDVVLFDDPSAIGLSSTWNMRRATEKRKMLELFDAFVYVKDFISLIIFTVPRLVGLAKFFRDIASWRVQVKKDGKVIFTRREVASTRSGTLKEVDIPEMFFYIKNPRIPNEIWNDMMEKRRRVIEQKIDKYEELEEDDADV